MEYIQKDYFYQKTNISRDIEIARENKADENKKSKPMNVEEENIKIIENFSLKDFNTFNIDVKSKFFVEINHLDELKYLLKNPKYKNVPKYVLGGGSNILFSKDYEGMIIKLNLKNIQIVQENKNFIYLKVYAGENWDKFVNFCVSKKYYGMENLSYIPGSVGAAPIQNIGAYGVELKDYLTELDAIEIKSGKLIVFNNRECKFGYRDSIFKNEAKGKYIIASITVRLHKNQKLKLTYDSLKKHLKEHKISKPTIEEVRNAVIEIRKSKLPDPKNIPNAGSFFKNPIVSSEDYQSLKEFFPNIPGKKTKNKYKIPAAWLIEQAGWRGKVYGGVSTYFKQPLVIINQNEVASKEILDYANQVRLAVKVKFKINLENEVNVL